MDEHFQMKFFFSSSRLYFEKWEIKQKQLWTKRLWDFSVYVLNLLSEVTTLQNLVTRRYKFSCLKVEAPHGWWKPARVWCPLLWWNWRCDIFNMSRDLTRTRDWRTIWRLGQSSSLYNTTLSRILTIGIVVVEICCFSFVT